MYNKIINPAVLIFVSFNPNGMQSGLIILM